MKQALRWRYAVKRKSGFTLIELLVVIAIIAVLAAILFPVFGRARAKATQTACLSNIKQIGLGIQMYCSDHGGMGPVALSNIGPYANWWWYFGVQGMPDMGVPGYVTDESLWNCPSPAIGAASPVTYSMPQWRTEWGTRMWSPDAQENPSKMMMVGESAYRGYGRPVFMAYPKYDAWSLTPLDMTVPHLEYCAHNGGNNVCYMDGHAKWVGLADFLVDFNWNDPNSGWGHW